MSLLGDSRSAEVSRPLSNSGGAEADRSRGCDIAPPILIHRCSLTLAECARKWSRPFIVDDQRRECVFHELTRNPRKWTGAKALAAEAVAFDRRNSGDAQRVGR